MEYLHASSLGDGSRWTLCGTRSERITQPKENVSCPLCKGILKHTRSCYPEHAEYTDWRLTAEQRREAAQDMARDMNGGADD